MQQNEGKLSAVIVHHLLDLFEQYGLNLADVLSEAGMKELKVDSANTWVPQSVCRDVILAASRVYHDHTLGLRLSQTTFPTGFGVVGHIAQASPTLNDIIQTILRYECLIGDIFHSTLEHEPGASVWTLVVDDDDPLVNRFMLDFALGTRHLLLRLLREKRANIVIEARFAYPAPPKEEQAVYEDVFRCPVRFNQPHSGLVFKTSALDLPLRHLDTGLKPALEHEADRQVQALKQETPFVERARQRLAVLIDQGTASRETLAADLGISSRHLHRELDNEGTSYSALLDTLRLERAELLLDTSATLEEIGQQLGFREASSFMRWYRQRTGHTARKKRPG